MRILVATLLVLVPFAAASAPLVHVEDPEGDTRTFVWPLTLPLVGWQELAPGMCDDAGSDVTAVAVESIEGVMVVTMQLRGATELTCAGADVPVASRSGGHRIRLWSQEPSVTFSTYPWSSEGPTTCVSMHWSDFNDHDACAPAVLGTSWSASLPVAGSVEVDDGTLRAYDLRGERTVGADTWTSHAVVDGPRRTYIGTSDVVDLVPFTL